MPACSRDWIHQHQGKNQEGKNTDKTSQARKKERKKRESISAHQRTSAPNCLFSLTSAE
jgi:hypothetical protein